MWYGYEEAPLAIYLVGVLMTAMLMMRLVPASSKDAAYRVLIQDNVYVVVNTTQQIISDISTP